jgi:hypothetical protein
MGCVSCLVKLTVRHVEKVVHHQRGVCALEIVLGLGRRHVHILNLVHENGRHFVNIPVPCRRCYHRLIQVQLENFLLFALRKSASKLFTSF